MCGYLQGKFSYDDLECGPCKIDIPCQWYSVCQSINTGKIMTQVMDDILKEQILEQLPSTSVTVAVSRYI